MPDSEHTTREPVLAHSSSAGEESWVPRSSGHPSEEAAWTGDLGTLVSATNSSLDEPSATSLDQSRADPESAARVEPEPQTNAAPVPHELNQSLARLELNSLEVKHYLDSIEEKISRMEPRLEQLRDFHPSTPISEEATPAPPVGATEPIVVPVESTTDRRRRRFDIPPSDLFLDRPGAPLSEAGPILEEEPWALKPWLLARRKQLAVAGIVFLAFITALTFGAGNHARPAAKPSTLTSDTAPSVAGSGISKSSAGTPAASPLSVPAPAPTSATPDITSALSGNTATSPLNATADPSTTNPEPHNIATRTPDSPSVTVKDSASAERGARPGLPVNPLPTGRVRVSSGVMAGNLLFSPTPRYPGGLASLFHTEGKVTLQAIIARNGRVEDLRVLSGHHLLRGAAQEAVRTWRYRPYSIGGVPVEVATIITVEFHR